ncbi:uncharacterized protein LOC105694971 [Orussus abietinus]|uniref:uncharacterized protein LOC105694971 n=1 Tax=Orussus abietinus TaxID=222816 RepID=UPI0006268CC0|nr:uncharacterized protein LOC105694971 [Orussus abietinus]XP_012271589.1 uncharacterized protein LOC105694971 [Orussus abietinus]
MVEPKRKSMLDFMRLNKRYDVCRLIYLARIVPSHEEDILKVFVNFAKEVFPDSVSGLLLVYPGYVLHLVESSEAEVFRVCSKFLDSHPDVFGASRCFPVQVEVRNRFFARWYARRVTRYVPSLPPVPAPLIRQVPDTFDNIARTYEETIVNLYKFYHELRMTSVTNHIRFMEKLESLYEGHPLLPEKAVVDFILNSRWGDSLQLLIENYRNPTFYDDDDIWPFSETTFPRIESQEIGHREEDSKAISESETTERSENKTSPNE